MKFNHSRPLSVKRELRVRSRLTLTERPRLTIFRSNKYTYLQVLDNEGKVMAVANTAQLKKAGKVADQTKLQAAEAAAQAIVDQLKSKKIDAVVLDRGPYRYHGRIKAVAEVLRKGSIKV